VILNVKEAVIPCITFVISKPTGHFENHTKAAGRFSNQNTFAFMRTNYFMVGNQEK